MIDLWVISLQSLGKLLELTPEEGKITSWFLVPFSAGKFQWIRALPGRAGLPIGVEYYFFWVLRGRPDFRKRTAGGRVCQADAAVWAHVQRCREQEREKLSGGGQVGLWKQTCSLTIGSHWSLGEESSICWFQQLLLFFQSICFFQQHFATVSCLTLWSRYPHAHFTDWKTETQKAEVTSGFEDLKPVLIISKALALSSMVCCLPVQNGIYSSRRLVRSSSWG